MDMLGVQYTHATNVLATVGDETSSEGKTYSEIESFS